MKHFEYYPKIEYSNNLAVNITVRGKIRDAIKQNTALYYKYSIKDGERPDIISSKYYGNSNYTWAIFYANDIFNPLTEWYIDHANFMKYLTKKYDSVEYSTQTIHHYEYADSYSDNVYVIDEQTYNSYLGKYETDSQKLRNVRTVSIFDYENEINDQRKNIYVLDKGYIFQITNELSNLFL
jgi:hypothetical protein